MNRNIVPAFYRYLQAQEEGVYSSSSRGRKGPPPPPVLSPVLRDAYARCGGYPAPSGKQVDGAKGFVEAIAGVMTLFKRAEDEGYTACGLWNTQGSLSYTDVLIAPCECLCSCMPTNANHVLRNGPTTVGLKHHVFLYAQVVDFHWFTGIFRATNVLKHYRGFVWPKDDALQVYVQKLLAHPAVKRTCSMEELYLDSYERSAYTPRPIARL